MRSVVSAVDVRGCPSHEHASFQWQIILLLTFGVVLLPSTLSPSY
jgi:hypothetical protein